MIRVAETAKEKVAMLMREEGFDPSNDFVRVGVKSGGCSGLSYDLKFDHQLRAQRMVMNELNVSLETCFKPCLFLVYKKILGIK